MISEFFHDLINLTHVQFFVKYWWLELIVIFTGYILWHFVEKKG